MVRRFHTASTRRSHSSVHWASLKADIQSNDASDCELTGFFIVNLLLNEPSKGARLRTRLSSRRKHCPQPNRRQRPILKHRYRLTGFKFRREQPFGASNGYPQPGKHPLPNALRTTNVQTSTHSNSDFRCSLAKDPCGPPGTSMLVNDHLMRDEFSRSLWQAVCFEIGACADHERSALSDFARCETGIGKIA
jgi:hypothetical protein